MATITFIHLKVGNLSLDNLAGLTAETVILGNAKLAFLGPLATAKLQVLSNESNRFKGLLNKEVGSPLTPAIRGEDKSRDRQFSEVKRTAKTASLSSQPATAEAGKKLVEMLKPFWNIDTEPMMSQTATLDIFKERYLNDPVAVAAATTLGLTTVLNSLFASNTMLLALYNERLNEQAAAAQPPASSAKPNLVLAYDDFCTSVKLTLTGMPSEELQQLFFELNDVRRKYVAHLPKPLDAAHTVVEPIAIQSYTGMPVTPLPKVHFRTDYGTVELQFSRDFTVTYRHNIDVGEAKLMVHGKGKYCGRYDTTFHIKRN
jgi:hypothetical protein